MWIEEFDETQMWIEEFDETQMWTEESDEQSYIIDAVRNFCIKKGEKPVEVRSFLEEWACHMWRRSENEVIPFVNKIQSCNESPMPDALRRKLRNIANAASNAVSSSRIAAPPSEPKFFGSEFVEAAEREWPDLVEAVSSNIERPCPSKLSDLKEYAQRGFQVIPMNFGQNNIACYLAWPPLLHMKHASEFVRNNNNISQREINEMITACVILKKQQGDIYASEHDRELPFFNWLNANFCNERTSCVVPQVSVPRIPNKVVETENPFTANGIIYARGGDNFRFKDKQEEDWADFKSGKLKINSKRIDKSSKIKSNRIAKSPKIKSNRIAKSPKIKSEQASDIKSWLQCDVGGVSAKDFLLQWDRPKESRKAWYCVIESKWEDNTLVLAQAAGYHSEHSRGRMRSNIPMFGIGLCGTTVRLGVFIFDRLSRPVVYELQTFSFQTGVLSLQELHDMAASFLTFRWLMLDAAERRAQIRDNHYWHVYPLSIPSQSNLRVNPTDLSFPPRRIFTDNFQEIGVQYRIEKFVKLTGATEEAMFTLMYRANAQRVVPSTEASAANIPIVVRFDARYGDEAHRKLAEKRFAPRLYCAEEYHPGYREIWFVVMDFLRTGSNAYRSLHALRGAGLLDDEAIQREIVKKLKGLNAALISENVVHGDLRPCNIFFSSYNNNFDLKVLDFEFGTTSSTGDPPVYPLTLNPEAYLEYGCDSPSSLAELCGSPITHAQDHRMVNYCIDYVETSRMEAESLPSSASHSSLPT